MIRIQKDKDFSKIFEHISREAYSMDIDISTLSNIAPYQMLIIAEYALLQRKYGKESILYCNQFNNRIVEESGLADYISNEGKENSALNEIIDYRIAPFCKITTDRIDEHILRMTQYFSSYCVGKDMTMINIVIAELLNNVFDHAESLIDATSFCWFNPQTNIISIAIADLGIGIPERVNRFNRENSLVELSSQDALKWAIQPKSTTKSSPQNRGSGINNIIDFVKANHSKLQIFSNDVRLFVNIHKQAFYVNPMQHFKGTIVEVDVHTKNLVALDNEFEDFSF